MAKDKNIESHELDIINIYSLLKALEAREGADVLGDRDYTEFCCVLRDIDEVGGHYHIKKKNYDRFKALMALDPQLEKSMEFKREQLLENTEGNDDKKKMRRLAAVAIDEFRNFSLPPDIDEIRARYFNKLYKDVEQELYNAGVIQNLGIKTVKKIMKPAPLVPLYIITLVATEEVPQKKTYEPVRYDELAKEIKQGVNLNYMLHNNMRNFQGFVRFLIENKNPDFSYFYHSVMENFASLNSMLSTKMVAKARTTKMEAIKREFFRIDNAIGEYIAEHNMENALTGFMNIYIGRVKAINSSGPATMSVDASRNSSSPAGRA